jgi:hypothetical protein
LCGLGIATVTLSRAVPVVAVLAGVGLCGMSIAGICSMSLRQQVTPDHLLGRITSAFWTVHSGLAPAGAALLTWAAARDGVRPVCVLAGAVCVLVAVVALGTPIRMPHPERMAVAAQGRG